MRSNLIPHTSYLIPQTSNLIPHTSYLKQTESSNSTMPLLLGTRASALAQWQAKWVAARLSEQGHSVELVNIVTHGDRNQQSRIEEIGAQNVFTKEIQQALLDKRIDLAVHSLKDLSTDEIAGIALAAVPQRGPVGDVLVWQAGDGIEALAQGATIGTGSLRRRTQLHHRRPDLRIEDIRGNVETRIAKLEDGRYDAIILAEAGLRRLGFEQWIGEILPKQIMLPAVGQGALGIETRHDDSAARSAVAPLEHAQTRAAVTAERAMLAALHGGCLAPIAGWARMENKQLTLSGRVLGHDGRDRLDVTLSTTDPQEAVALGRRVAEELAAQGADTLIQNARHK